MISELGVYLVSALGCYYSLAVRAISAYRGRLFCVLSVIGLGLVAALRGGVGTDTASYEAMVAILCNPSDWYGVEPGFAMLVWMLGWFTESDVVLVRLIAVVFVAGLLLFIRRADRDETFFLLAFFLPAVFFQYSMNALRVGLGVIFLLLSMQHLRRNELTRALLLLVAGWLFHYSLIMSMVYLLVSARLLSVRVFSAFVVAGLLFISVVVLQFGDYLLTKVVLYGDYEPPSGLSGLSSLVILAVLLVGATVSSISHRSRIVFALASAASIGAAFALARFSYAGLRVLDLLVTGLPVSLMMLHGREAVPLNWKSKGSLVLAGLVGLGTTLFRFVTTPGDGSTPWVPYEWIF